MKKNKFLAALLLLFVFFLPCTSVLAEETISDVLTGWVYAVDGEKIIINDTTLRFSSHVEYLGQNGLPVEILNFGNQDEVLYRVNGENEIVSIQKGTNRLPENDSEVIEKNSATESQLGNKKLKFVDGVWTN